ncbi:MAG: hypothetical protein ABFE07_15325 [Armatimonadia bacterium]
MIHGIVNQWDVDCTYSFNADESELISFLGVDGRLALSMANQKGSYTTTGTGFLSAMAPAGLPTNTQQVFDNTSGKVAIEFAVVCPSNSGSADVVVSAAADDVLVQDIFSLDVTAKADGTFSVDMYYNTPFTSLYQATGLITAPSRLGVLTDADAGTIQLYMDNAPVVMNDDTLRTGTDVTLAMYVTEFTGAQSGLVYSIEAITSTSGMTGSYPGGTKTICGTNL